MTPFEGMLFGHSSVLSCSFSLILPDQLVSCNTTLEGVSSSREAFRPYLALSIWIETPHEERLQRGLERDGETARPQWEEWMAREDEYVEREHPEQKAHLVINGTEPYDL